MLWQKNLLLENNKQKCFNYSQQIWMINYGTCPKISNTFFHTFYFIKILLFMQLFFKILSGMVNSVDPDQTVVWSWSELFAYDILLDFLVYEILGQLP